VSKAKSQQLHITWGEVVVVVAVSERVSETCWLTQRVLVLFACAKAKQRLSLREREKKQNADGGVWIRSKLMGSD
jgi:hypothetical protein